MDLRLESVEIFLLMAISEMISFKILSVKVSKTKEFKFAFLSVEKCLRKFFFMGDENYWMEWPSVLTFLIILRQMWSYYFHITKCTLFCFHRLLLIDGARYLLSSLKSNHYIPTGLWISTTIYVKKRLQL